MTGTPEKTLRAMVQVFVGSRDRVERSSRLHHDLRLSGDDAADLIENVNKYFGTDFSDFTFDNYFPDETEALLSPIFEAIGLSKRKEFTFNHLVRVVEVGRWFDPGSAMDNF